DDSTETFSKYDGKYWTDFSAKKNTNAKFLHDFAIDSKNNLWFATDSGIKIFDGSGSWKNYKVANGNWVESIGIDAKDNMYYLLGDSALDEHWYKYDGKLDVKLNNSLDHYYLYIDPKGTKWFGSDGFGLTKYDDTTTELIQKANTNAPCDELKPLAMDKDGN